MKKRSEFFCEEPGRRNPSPGGQVQSSGPTIVFLTVSTLKRQPWLANGTAHDLLREVWRHARAWLVGNYMLMPDHLHLVCTPGEQDTEIENWIRYWKREFRLRHANAGWRFQSRGWHHRLRAHESYSEKWDYMMENPVRKGLVKTPDEWPFRGGVFDLRWE